ncbi:hypothetical protein FACS1894187_23370 [Synergistales bacterium]|nr:hypothetical protein FACS1894187_23370 [Synergistales bacterium]
MLSKILGIASVKTCRPPIYPYSKHPSNAESANLSRITAKGKFSLE